MEAEATYRARILDAACLQVRRYGEGKTNVLDIARALGTSHTTIYRHFRSKADIFDAVVEQAMRDEVELGEHFVADDGPAGERLGGLVLALHRRKRERFADDPEVYRLYRRIVEERPQIIANYSAAMTGLIARILAAGVERGEFAIDDIEQAAGVVRDAVTVFVHPAFVEAGVAAQLPMERMALSVVDTLVIAFACRVQRQSGSGAARRRAAGRAKSSSAVAATSDDAAV